MMRDEAIVASGFAGLGLGIAAFVVVARKLKPGFDERIAGMTNPLLNNPELDLKARILDLYHQGQSGSTWNEFAHGLRSSSDPLAKDFCSFFGPKTVVVNNWWRGTRTYVQVNPYWQVISSLEGHTRQTLIDLHRSRFVYAMGWIGGVGLPAMFAGMVIGSAVGTVGAGFASRF